MSSGYRATYGEQNWGFILGEMGYEFIEGPSGGGGHPFNAGGFDGIAYNPKTEDLIIGDNKAYKRTGNVTSGTALDPSVNLEQNLRGSIEHLESHPNLRQFPHRDLVLTRLRASEQALSNWKTAGSPAGRLNLGGTRLVIFGVGGNSTGVGGKLARSGAVEFENLNSTIITEAEIGGARRVRLPRPGVGATIAKAVGPAIALGILQYTMKEAIASDLASMKQPGTDLRSAKDYFKDAKTSRSVRFIDLMNKNLTPFTDELERHHLEVVTKINLQVMALSLSRSRPTEERLEFLSALRDDLAAYGDQVDIVRDNLAAAQDLAPDLEKTATDADQLAKAADTLLGKDLLMKAGVDNDDIFGGIDHPALSDRFEAIADDTRAVNRRVKAAYAKVRRIDDEIGTLYRQLLKLEWMIILTPLIVPGKQAPAPPEPISQGTLRVYAAMGPGTPRLRLQQIKDRVKKQPGDFIPKVETALQELSKAGMITLMEGHGGLIIEGWRNKP